MEVSNDELVVTDEDGRLFEYNPNNAESQRVQKTLFHEKQSLIENCLFGVDINPNSAKICRLRLWIELLKNAYYKPDGQLETLPNIDINIKTGNSLISRYGLDVDLKQALHKSGLSIEDYRNAVNTYRNAASKDEKRDMERLIASIKNNFRSEIANNDPKVIKLENLNVKLASLKQAQLFEESAAQKNEREKLEKEISKLSAELEAIKSNKIFENAFEWRFEFPEVLDDGGEFVGFDVILGNPPYIRQEAISPLKTQLQATYTTYHGSADLLVYFVELGVRLLSEQGKFSFIIANKWMRSSYGKPLRAWLKTKRLVQIIDYGDLPVFEEATTYPCILSVDKGEPSETLHVVKMDELAFDQLSDYVEANRYEQAQAELDDEGWSLANQDVQKVLNKLNKVGVPLEEYVDGKIYYGIKTGLNEAFVIDEATKNKLIAEDPKSNEVIKPFLAGRDVKRYEPLNSEKFLIFARRGIDIDDYPAVKKHLEQFKDRLMPKPKDWTGKNWSGRKPGPYEWYEIQDTVAYFQELEKPKILFPDIGTRGQFTFDSCGGYYAVNTIYFIPSADKYLLSLINSSLMTFVYSNAFAVYRGGYLRFFSQYVEQLPIRSIDFSNPTDRAAHDRMTGLVETMLELHKQKADASGDALTSLETRITELDAEIDALVYELYDLSEEEIGVLEGAVAG